MKIGAFDKVIGILGNPTNPDVAWSDSQLTAIRDIGVDTIQLSIAWSWKPANEVLNMEDLDDPHVHALYKERIKKAHAHGLSALAHFGIPYTDNFLKPACIMNPTVLSKYQTRLEKFFSESDADEIMIYNYDQSAWLCSEFDDCPNCKGVPLHTRLGPFLDALASTVQSVKPGGMFWWEPWELSEGQMISVIENITADNFGIIMHSNIAEVNFNNMIDLPSRNIARLAKTRGMPFISEGFFGGSGEDIEGLTHMPCPRLVYQQLESMKRTYGLTGIKEYYGFVPADFSVNTAMFRMYLQSPDMRFDDMLTAIAKAYGEKGALKEAWEMAAQGLEIFPYNASWWLRFILSKPETQSWTRIKEADWETPAWKTNRRGYYMVTSEQEQHPWLYEDVSLRAMAAAQRFKKAVKFLDQANVRPEMKIDIAMQKRDITKIMEAAYAFAHSIGNY